MSTQKAARGYRGNRKVATAEQRVAQYRGGAAMPLTHGIVERQRLPAPQDEADEVVIVEIGADAGQVGNDRNPVRAQQLRRTEARQLQQLRRIECARGDDDLGVDHRDAPLPADFVLDARCTLPIEQDARRQCYGDDLEVVPLAHRSEIGHGGR